MLGLVVGLGQMGQNHKRVLEGLGHQVVTVDPAGHADYKYLKAAPNADFACIATPPGQLVTMAAATIERGIPTLVEKPMATCSRSARMLVQHAATYDVPLAVGYVERFNPAVEVAHEAVAEIGTVRHYLARRLSPNPGRQMGDVALDLASHEVDLLLQAGFLRGGTQIRRGDHFIGLWRFEDGAATVEASWLAPTKLRQVTITGDEGVVEMDYAAQRVLVSRNGVTTAIHVHKSEPLRRQWQSFLAGDIEVSGLDGIDVLDTLAPPTPTHTGIEHDTHAAIC